MLIVLAFAVRFAAIIPLSRIVPVLFALGTALPLEEFLANAREGLVCGISGYFQENSK